MAARPDYATMDKALRRNIVISAVNVRKGGTLTILKGCLQYLSGREDLHVTAIVHKRSLCDYPGIDYIEIPWSIKGWLRRLWCEYVTLFGISKRLVDTDLWFSLHDTTPRVKARRQAVYCHTSFPFMKASWRDVRMDYKIALFSRFTKFAYKWNVKKNSYLVVQQTWMRDAMAGLLKFPKDRIIVAPPAIKGDSFATLGMTKEPSLEMTKELSLEKTRERSKVFLFPGTPDCHKNFETLCEAARILENRVGKGCFKVLLTVRGEENRYARWLKVRWGEVSSIDFHGLMSRDELEQAYGEAACLVFPSRSETWGLPISEFKPTGKPMILADLPYAHETAAGARQVAFFPVKDPEALAKAMENVLTGNTIDFGTVPVRVIESPYAYGWEQLFHFLLDDNQD